MRTVQFVLLLTPLAATTACTSNAEAPVTDTVTLTCSQDINTYCATTPCAPTAKQAAADPSLCARGSVTRESCGGYDVVTAMGTDTVFELYYKDDVLVAAVYNGVPSPTFCAGPATFDEVQCSGASSVVSPCP